MASLIAHLHRYVRDTKAAGVKLNDPRPAEFLQQELVVQQWLLSVPAYGRLLPGHSRSMTGPSYFKHETLCNIAEPPQVNPHGLRGRTKCLCNFHRIHPEPPRAEGNCDKQL